MVAAPHKKKKHQNDVNKWSTHRSHTGVNKLGAKQLSISGFNR
jgi:hypothetical protein